LRFAPLIAAFGLAFRQTTQDVEAFEIMGAVVMGCSILPIFINIKGYKGILFGEQNEDDRSKEKWSFSPQTMTPATSASDLTSLDVYDPNGPGGEVREEGRRGGGEEGERSGERDDKPK